MVRNPSWRELVRSPVLLLAFGFGSGKSPKAPGTMGTLAAIPFWLLLVQLPQWAVIAVIVVAALAGIAICGKAAEQMGVHDHGGIVWDEFVGYWIAMLAAPPGITGVVAGFVLFRIFDVIKPWPISWFDRNVHGGWGIMLDDLLAGVMAALSLMLVTLV